MNGEFPIQIQHFDHDLVAADRECTVGNERFIRPGVEQHPRHVAHPVFVLIFDICEDLVQVTGMKRPAVKAFPCHAGIVFRIDNQGVAALPQGHIRLHDRKKFAAFALL